MRVLFLLMTVGGNLAQWSVVPGLAVGGVTPDLPLMLTVFLALRGGPEAGCLAGFVTGFLQDMAGGGLVGVGLWLVPPPPAQVSFQDEVRQHLVQMSNPLSDQTSYVIEARYP